MAKASKSSSSKLFGLFGTIKESDFYNKQMEFEEYVREVKKKEVLDLPQWESKDMFKSYVEDYNTATLPSEKYYDLHKWECAQAVKRKEREAKLLAKGLSGGNVDFAADEASIRRERSERDAKARNRLMAEALISMDKDKANDMKEQDLLRNQMQTYWRTGNTVEAERIRARLEAVDEETFSNAVRITI